MGNKAVLIQRQYSADFESKYDYIIVVEVVEDIPVASCTTIHVPTPKASSPLLLHIKH